MKIYNKEPLYIGIIGSIITGVLSWATWGQPNPAGVPPYILFAGLFVMSLLNIPCAFIKDFEGMSLFFNKDDKSN